MRARTRTRVGGGHGEGSWRLDPAGSFGGLGRSPVDQPRIHALTDDGGDRYDAFWSWVGAHNPSEDQWQLDSIAVDPSVQRRGYGRALILAGLARARADGVGAFLSTGTEHNVTIYGKYGFRVVERAHAPHGGPPIWFMRWEPGRPGETPPR